MQNPDIIIPTCRTREQMSPMICDIQGFSQGCRVFATCTKASAAVNRNIGRNWCESDIIIMLDDDISGFYDGWWQELIRPLLEDESVVYVSANLLYRDGTDSPMMFRGDPHVRLNEVPRAPTAAVAFRNDNIRFDEKYIGSGYEDDDFCVQLRERYPEGRVVVNNNVRLVHDNEQKNQGAGYIEKNKAYFEQKFKGNRDGRYYGIPTIIHFIWLGSPVPSWIQRNIDEFKRLNPNFKIILHGDDTNLEWPYSEAVRKISGKHEYERKSDVIRLAMLEKYGGWYFDCDFWPLRSITDICEDHDISCGCFLTLSGDRIVANGVIGMRKRAPAMKMLRDGIIVATHHEEFIHDENQKWGSFGPKAYTAAFAGEDRRNVVLGENDMFYKISKEDFQEQYKQVQDLSKIKLNTDKKPYMYHFHMQGRKTL